MNLGIFVSVLGGASVEFFETAAIAYAIARSGYWRKATLGTITGLALVGVNVEEVRIARPLPPNCVWISTVPSSLTVNP